VGPFQHLVADYTNGRWVIILIHKNTNKPYNKGNQPRERT
jgi:hypothetical protein